MNRLAAACLAVACLAPALAGSNASAQSATPASHRPPPIPGTLDPATGKFTPDAAGSGSGSSNVDKGTIYLRFALDAVHPVSVTVACSIVVDYTVQIFPSGAFIGVGSDRSVLDLTYSKAFGKFFDDLKIPYAVNEGVFPQDVFVDIDVTCRYTFDPATTIFHGVISGNINDFNRASNQVQVEGVMNGQHLG